MKLNVKAAALAGALVWGVLVMFLVGVGNLIWEEYGREFLRAVASVYPGYHAERTAGQVIVGTLYGIVDGAVCGAIVAWLYNLLATPRAEQAAN